MAWRRGDDAISGRGSMTDVTSFRSGLPGGHLCSDISDPPLRIRHLLYLLCLRRLDGYAGGFLPTHPNEGDIGPEIQPMLLSRPCSQAGTCTHPGKEVPSLAFVQAGRAVL